MIKKLVFYVSAAALVVLQSCSINTETTYYKDTATSMESNILLDQSALGMMSMMNSQDKTSSLPNLSTLTKNWQSLYEIQKDGKIVLNSDSAAVLKKMFMKLNEKDGQILGISLKYDKLLPKEITTLLANSSQLKGVPMQDVGKWDGKKLIIDTEKFNTSNFFEAFEENSNNASSAPKTKQDSLQNYGKDMAKSMIGMMRMFNSNINSTLKFQKPIKSIEGKHDFVTQLDNKTIQIHVRTNDLLDGKKLQNADKQIIITTE